MDSTFLVEVFHPNQAKKLPNAQQNRVAATLAEIGGAGAPVQSVAGKTGAVILDAADVAGVVDDTTAQTVGGVKTFSDSPVVPVPSDGTEAANKNYVDAQITVVDQGKVSQSSTPSQVYGTSGAGAQTLYPINVTSGLVQLDGSTKVPTAFLPPLEHDVGQAADEAAMLALAVSAPAMCIRTDFTPPHLFFLSGDPATSLANWHDMGAFAGAAGSPSALVGLAAIPGVSADYMRSDGAPALNQAIVPTWTGAHTFTQTMTVAAINASGLISSSGGVAGNTSVTAGIGSNSVQMDGAPNGQDVKIQALGVTDANVSIELKAKGTGLLKLASPTSVAGPLTVAGTASAAQGAGAASPTNSGINLAPAPNWGMAQFYDSARAANDRTMDILFIGDGLHMRFVNDARNAFLDFLSVQGGQASGVTGVATTSGSGAWAHTGAMTVSGGVTSPAASATAALAGLVKRGVAVPDAAGSEPSKAEFDALLASLRTAGVIAN